MSQKYLIRIAELERLLSEQAEALRQKDQQLSLVEETEAFLRSALTRAEEKIEEDEREIEHLRAQIEKLRRMLFGIHHHLFENLRRKGHHCHGLTHLSWAERKIFYRVLGKKFCGLFIYPGQSVRQVVAVYAPGDRGLNR